MPETKSLPARQSEGSLLKPSLAVILFIFGIMVPFAALFVELTTHLCSCVFFDPLPNLPALIFVACVPIANALASTVLTTRNMKWLPLAGVLNSVALCTTAIYAVIFLPLLPIGVIALLIYGLGFLCMAPLLSFVATLMVRRQLSRLLKAQGKKLIPADLCISLLLIASALATFSGNLTRSCEMEIAAHPEKICKNLLLMRAFGDREILLRSCYGLEDANFFWANFGSSMVWLGYNMAFHRTDYNNPNVANELSRELYYRVTGRSFNAVPRPKPRPSDHYYFDESDYYYYEYDQDFAGEAVGGVVRDLKLSSSKIGGEYDPDLAAEHLVWTMKFAKSGYGSRELRAQILLPPGAVVSGAWLMVNGSRRNAIFQARQEARKGYEAEARRGDSGLLIATAGPSRVLIQAPSVNNDLELCLQIDAPMNVLQANKALTTLPCLTERNFELSCKTVVDLTQAERLPDNISAASIPQQTTKTDSHEKLMLSNAEMFAGTIAAGTQPLREHKRNQQKNRVIVNNPFVPQYSVVQTIEKLKAPPSRPLYVILDGSDSMSGCIKPVCDSIENIASQDATLVWASDEPSFVVRHVNTGSPNWKKAIARIRDSACVGGQDNGAALKLALQDCSVGRGADIVWLHGPQAIKFTGSDFKVTWRPYSRTCALYEYQAVLGPNELIRSLDTCGGLSVVPHWSGMKQDLALLFGQIDGSRDRFLIERKFEAPEPGIDAAYLNQLCAGDFIRNELLIPGNHAEATQTAEKYGIVTPFTSCVVLLDPPPPVKIPVVVPRGSSLATGETAGKSTSGTPAESAESPPAASMPVKSPGPSFIPTQPEPPLNLLMICTLLVSSFMFWKLRVRKARCL